jgi:hypothetical protein
MIWHGFTDVLTLDFIVKCLILMLIFGGSAVGVMAIGTLAGGKDDS